MKERSARILILTKETSACYNIVLSGTSGVGKTSLVNRFCRDECPSEHKQTVGVGYYEKTIADECFKEGNHTSSSPFTIGFDPFVSNNRSEAYDFRHGGISVCDGSCFKVPQESDRLGAICMVPC